jgi:hypothetical protein
MLGIVKNDLKNYMTFLINGNKIQSKQKNSLMKNNYEIKQHYIVQLENEQLRERIKELVTQFNELKKKYEDKEREGMVQSEGINSTIEER